MECDFPCPTCHPDLAGSGPEAGLREALMEDVTNLSRFVTSTGEYVDIEAVLDVIHMRLAATPTASPTEAGLDVDRLAEAMRPLFDGPEPVHLERLGWWEGDLLALTRRDIAARVSRGYADAIIPSDYPEEGPVPTSVQNAWNDASEERDGEPTGRWSRSGWHVLACWRQFAEDPDGGRCTCEISRAIESARAASPTATGERS